MTPTKPKTFRYNRSQASLPEKRQASRKSPDRITEQTMADPQKQAAIATARKISQAYEAHGFLLDVSDCRCIRSIAAIHPVGTPALQRGSMGLSFSEEMANLRNLFTHFLTELTQATDEAAQGATFTRFKMKVAQAAYEHIQASSRRLTTQSQSIEKGQDIPADPEASMLVAYAVMLDMYASVNAILRNETPNRVDLSEDRHAHLPEEKSAIPRGENLARPSEQQEGDLTWIRRTYQDITASLAVLTGGTSTANHITQMLAEARTGLHGWISGTFAPLLRQASCTGGGLVLGALLTWLGQPDCSTLHEQRY
ncbi:MAG: hypothetical protein Q9166_006733 [cf. Caloplaca sp. 2 TL-2023]